MWTADTEQLGQLVKIISAMHGIISEATAQLTAEGLVILSMDASKSCMVSVVWKPEKLQHTADHTIGIHIEKFTKILKDYSDSSHLVTLTLADSKQDVLTLTYENADATVKGCVEVPLLELDEEIFDLTPVPAPPTHTRKMFSNMFATMCRLMRDYSDDAKPPLVSIDMQTPRRIMFKCHGSHKLQQEQQTLDEDVAVGEKRALEDSVAEDLKALSEQKFSGKYLHMFAKSAALSKVVSISLTSDYPLTIKFDLDCGHVYYYLAPRIEA